jgi:transmembrane sensor
MRAVGTAFNVRRRGDSALDLLVTEGLVRTYESEEETAASVAAGHLLRIDEHGDAALRRVSSDEVDRLMAWQRGELILDGITLEAAMAEVSRYTPRRIRIDDPKLRALRLGGSFPTNDLGAVLRTLRANFGIEAREDDGGTLVLQQVTGGAG